MDGVPSGSRDGFAVKSWGVVFHLDLNHYGNLVPWRKLQIFVDACSWSEFGPFDDISTIWMLIDGNAPEVQEIEQRYSVASDLLCLLQHRSFLFGVWKYHISDHFWIYFFFTLL